MMPQSSGMGSLAGRGNLEGGEWVHEMTVSQHRQLAGRAVPEDDGRVRLVRNVSVASFIAFAVVTVMLMALYRQVVLASLRELAEHGNVKLTRTFADLLWPRFLAFVGSAGGLRPETL